MEGLEIVKSQVVSIWQLSSKDFGRTKFVWRRDPSTVQHRNTLSTPAEHVHRQKIVVAMLRREELQSIDGGSDLQIVLPGLIVSFAPSAAYKSGIPSLLKMSPSQLPAHISNILTHRPPAPYPQAPP